MIYLFIVWKVESNMTFLIKFIQVYYGNMWTVHLLLQSCALWWALDQKQLFPAVSDTWD